MVAGLLGLAERIRSWEQTVRERPSLAAASVRAVVYFVMLANRYLARSVFSSGTIVERAAGHASLEIGPAGFADMIEEHLFPPYGSQTRSWFAYQPE